VTERDAAGASSSDPEFSRWYHGITRYQWLVLVIASLGWVFDVFEGQIFVASMNDAMPQLLASESSRGEIEYYNNVALIAFLLGGAIGGVLFGVVSDRIGRKKTMSYTILMYSVFTCLTAFSESWWHMAAFRFLVAMGVGGEWAVASAMVAEVFPPRARAWSLGIFHASSVLGTYLAIAAGFLIPHIGWRAGFAMGAVPALLIVWIRSSLREPEDWQRARSSALAGLGEKLGSFGELFDAALLRSTVVGVGLAAVGLATFWGVHIKGKDLLRQSAATGSVAASDGQATATPEAAHEQAAYVKRMEMLGMLLVTTGGGLGLVSFGPVCERVGRRAAFLVYHIGGLVITLLLFGPLAGADRVTLCAVLPIFGFLTLGMHAGYAIYFPELFPTRLRSTGGGFCFNVGRILAAPVLFLSGWMQKDWEYSLESAASILGLLFLGGIVLLLFAPETKGRELPQ
jgi:MFS family permease